MPLTTGSGRGPARCARSRAAFVALTALITGDRINLGSLGTVPSANTANTANSANTASNANTANTANQAHNIDAPEGIHIVGAAGEPGFLNGCTDASGPLQPVGFYKDKEGIVHLQGAMMCPSASTIAFQLPSGYRPASGTAVVTAVACNCSGANTGELTIAGPGIAPADDGAVIDPGTTVETTGSTFRPGA